MTPDEATEIDAADAAAFAFFNEIGIIGQLSTAVFARTLPDGVHPSHFAILNHLVRTGDGKTPIRIARAMQVTKTTMTHSLKVLEDRGFIDVGPNPDDARGKLVRLTDEGRRFRDVAIARVSERMRAILRPEDRARMARCLDDLTEVRRHLDASRD